MGPRRSSPGARVNSKQPKGATSAEPRTRGDAWSTAGVALLAGLLYGPTLRYGLVWDDPISLFRWLPALSGWTSVFFPPGGIPQFPPDYYRPLQLLSYKLDLALGGGRIWVFHLSSVLWHAIASALVTRTARELFRTMPHAQLASIVAGILFAIHPIHTESVAWMAARVDPMVTTFLLAALLLLRPARRTQRTNWFLAGLLVFAALLTKEVAMAAIVLVPTWLWATPMPGAPASVVTKRDLLRAVAMCGLLVAVYTALRVRGLEHYHGTPVVVPPDIAPTSLAALGWYTAKLFWPFPQVAFVPRVPQDPVYLLAGAAAVASTVYLGLRAAKPGGMPTLYCLLWYWSTLFPALALLLKPPSAPLAERYLYLPSVAFAWGSGWMVARAYDRLSASPMRRLAVQVFAIVVALALAIATVRRNEIWRDNFALWSDTAEKTTADGFPLRNLAAAYLEAGQTERARELLHRALHLPNTPLGMASIHSNLGTIALYAQDWERARAHYRQAYDLQPSGDIAFNLGVASLRQADSSTGPEYQSLLDDAVRWLHTAVGSSPNDPDIQFAYAESLRLHGELREAQKHYRHALELGLPPERAEHARRYVHDIIPEKERGQRSAGP